MELSYHRNPFRKELTCCQCGVSNRERFVHSATPRLSIDRRPNQLYVYHAPICSDCFRRLMREEGQPLHELESNIHAWVVRQLKNIGLSDEERQADINKIPQVILDAIPDEVLHNMLAGSFPTKGFGLAGMARVGKSSAMAALVHTLVLQNATNKAPFVQLSSVKTVAWMNWPQTCHRWRLNGVDASVEQTITKACKVKLLIIDDIGRETKRREAGEDVATGHLDAIITARNRENLVTLWTSNRSKEELLTRYETAMVYRLLGKSPMTWLEEADFHPDANCR